MLYSVCGVVLVGGHGVLGVAAGVDCAGEETDALVSVIAAAVTGWWVFLQDRVSVLFLALH